MQRILVLGSSGAGKSTLACRLGAALDLPVVHLDVHYWQPGWTEPDRAAWDARVAELVRAPAWVMDGNFARVLPPRLEAADTVVYLDVSRWRCLWRVLRRLARYRGRNRPDLAPGCPSSSTRRSSPWVWNFPARSRPATLRMIDAAVARRELVVHHLRGVRAIERWIAAIERGGGAARE